MNISNRRIELLLAEQKLNKKQLSECSGISRQSISTILRRGTCEPKTAGKLAAALHCAPADIIEED